MKTWYGWDMADPDFEALPSPLRRALAHAGVTRFSDLEKDWDVQRLHKTRGIARRYSRLVAARMAERGTPLPEWPPWLLGRRARR